MGKVVTKEHIIPENQHIASCHVMWRTTETSACYPHHTVLVFMLPKRRCLTVRESTVDGNDDHELGILMRTSNL
jgi:hypothetical protein